MPANARSSRNACPPDQKISPASLQLCIPVYVHPPSPPILSPPFTTYLHLPILHDAPLPLPEHGQEAPEVELGPQEVEEDDAGVLMALPEHEVGEAADSRCADEEVERWVGRGEGVGC